MSLDRHGHPEEGHFTFWHSPIRDESGGVGGVLVTATETTGRVLDERRMRTSRRLDEASEQPELVATVGRGTAGPAGSDRERAAPRLPPSADDSFVRGGGEMGALLRAHDWSTTCLGSIAEWPQSPWSYNPTIGETGGIAGLFAIASETTRQVVGDRRLRTLRELSLRTAFEQETQRAEKLAELDRAKTSFFSNVSHELRTPLTLILGPVEDALAQPARALEGAKLELVRRNALRLYKMVNTLLDFSRIEAGRAQATFVPTDLAALTVSLVSHFHSAAEGAGLELVVDCPPLPEAIYVDPEMWEKIVLNLLSNAVKYTHRGQIRVAVAWEDDMAVVTVQDTGVGIAEDEMPRVFERFYRVRAIQGRSHEGTGIGLALARELVELHGGDIAVTSKLGEGTTFTVRLQRGPAHLPPERIERTATPRASTAGAAVFVEEAVRWSADPGGGIGPGPEKLDGATAGMPSPLVPSRILLVDDNADLRAYVAGVLGRVFPNLETATNGSEALEQARAHPPDLIVSDVMMPLLDGFELVRALRADERTRSVPIILLSARAGDEPTVEGLDSGADDYLVKPFSARELMARVRGQLEMSRVRAEVWRERGQVEELRHSIAARDEFLAIVSHELRTPLTALGVQIEHLLRLSAKGKLAGADGQLTGKLQIASRQLDRLARLTEALLDLSRVAMGRLELKRDEFDLAEVLRRVVDRFAPDARSSQSTLRLDAVSVRGRWDEARIEDVLGHLVANAVKYAPGAPIEIALTADEAAARVVVRDFGPGIPPAALDRIFDRFERGVSSEHYGGFGIGLSLARQVVEAHGGTIQGQSSPGRGSTFTVTVPRETAGMPPATPPRAASEPEVHPWPATD